MPSGEAVDTDRTVVTTYVPAYQKADWEAHAEDLGMSQAEFVRTMVQAGRRGFGVSPAEKAQTSENQPTGPDTRPGSMGHESEEPGVPGPNPGGSLRETVLQTLEERGPLSWDELVEDVIGDIETDLEEAVMELVESNAITHLPRKGKYTIVEEE